MERGGDRQSRKAELESAQRESRVLELYARGFTFAEIASAVGFARRGAAHAAYKRAMRKILLPHGVEAKRLAQERMHGLFRKLWGELADAKDTAIRLAVIDRILHAERRYAELMGLDAPKGMILDLTMPDEPSAITPEQMARLTPDQQLVLLGLLAKLYGKDTPLAEYAEESAPEFDYEVEAKALPAPDKPAERDPQSVVAEMERTSARIAELRRKLYDPDPLIRENDPVMRAVLEKELRKLTFGGNGNDDG